MNWIKNLIETARKGIIPKPNKDIASKVESMTSKFDSTLNYAVELYYVNGYYDGMISATNICSDYLKLGNFKQDEFIKQAELSKINNIKILKQKYEIKDEEI